MPLPANWTTTIPAEKSIGEIVGILQQHRATKILLEQARETGETLSISFMVMGKEGEMPFRLPANPAGIRRVLQRERGLHILEVLP